MFGRIFELLTKNGLVVKKSVDNVVFVPEVQLIREINKFKFSKKALDMRVGENYFEGRHDILNKTRQAIGNNGDLVDIKNLPNNRIIDNQYKKMVIQKVNYLLGKPILFQTSSERYGAVLTRIVSKRLMKTINDIGVDCLNCGIGWLYVYYNEVGELSFKRFRPYEVIPVWLDEEHSILDYAIRIYDKRYYKGGVETTVQKVEVYTLDGIQHYEYNEGKLVKCEVFNTPYFAVHNGKYTQEFNWSRIPLIDFKYNNREIPLVNMVKSLQDGINVILSNFQDNIQEDPRNTIMVLVNYGGENLGEFRQNLATYGAVKVQSEEGVVGDVKTINVEVNAENYKMILSLFKEAIVENGMSYNTRDDRLSSNPNQMNIKSLYSDIELDANGMELEFQASLESLLWFINRHLENTGLGDIIDDRVDVIFNRDMMLNESSVISDISKSVGLLSRKTLVEQHPYVLDVGRELERLSEEGVSSEV